MLAALIIVIVIVVLVALIFGVGAMLPERHRSEGERTLPAPPERVWELIADPDHAAYWRSDVARTEILSATKVREVDPKGKGITFETVRSEAPRVLVRRIADENLPFGGEWTLTVEPAVGGSRLHIVEDGFVKPALFRFVSKYVIGQDKTINRYLDDLNKHLSR